MPWKTGIVFFREICKLRCFQLSWWILKSKKQKKMENPVDMRMQWLANHSMSAVYRIFISIPMLSISTHDVTVIHKEMTPPPSPPRSIENIDSPDKVYPFNVFLYSETFSLPRDTVLSVTIRDFTRLANQGRVLQVITCAFLTKNWIKIKKNR